MSNESKASWEKKTPFWKKGFGSKSTVTTGDGIAIFSEAYTDKTIYERFEQPFQCSADNVETDTPNPFATL